MTWMNKGLTLDLLAIGIDTLQRTYDRIKQEPDSVSPWPQVESTQAAPGAVEETQTPAPAPQPQPEPEAPQEPEDQATDLLPEAQTILRHISLAEGPAWIRRTLSALRGQDPHRRAKGQITGAHRHGHQAQGGPR